MPEPSEQDALRAVREHLDEAHAAADRLVHEAQRQAEEAEGAPREAVPPRGWDAGHLRLAVPFAGKGDVSLKKVGDELVVRVDGRKRTVVLPPALAALKPAGAALEGGALVVRFA